MFPPMAVSSWFKDWLRCGCSDDNFVVQVCFSRLDIKGTDGMDTG